MNKKLVLGLLSIFVLGFLIQSCTKENLKTNSQVKHKLGYNWETDIYNAMNSKIPEVQNGEYTGNCVSGQGGCVSVVITPSSFREAVMDNTYRAYLSEPLNFADIAQNDPYVTNILNHVVIGNLDIIMGNNYNNQFKIGLTGVTSQENYITTIFAN